MEISKIITLILFCAIGVANAEVTVQTLCFSSQKNRRLELTLRKYLDEELQQEVGALVRYSNSNKLIPLAFKGDENSDERVAYELHWLEIVDKKITGEYSFIKPLNATVDGAYVVYKNFKTNKQTTFTPSSKSGTECSFN